MTPRTGTAPGGSTFRPAEIADLPALIRLYRGIVRRMTGTVGQIWDDVYPTDFFAEDIAAGRLFLLTDGGEPVAAFALCREHTGEGAVRWQRPGASVLYLERFGVDAARQGTGLGTLLLRYAAQAAAERGASFLRLFVVDRNTPALALYRRYGFMQADGVYEENIDGLILRQYGFELAPGAVSELPHV